MHYLCRLPSPQGLPYHQIPKQLLQMAPVSRNDVISGKASPPSISDTISHSGLFGHVARLTADVPTHKALNSQINGRPPDTQYRHVIRVVLVTDGLTTTSHLLSSGGVLSVVVTAERRYDPCRISFNNNSNNLAGFDTFPVSFDIRRSDLSVLQFRRALKTFLYD